MGRKLKTFCSHRSQQYSGIGTAAAAATLFGLILIFVTPFQIDKQFDVTSLKNDNKVVFVYTKHVTLYTLGEISCFICYIQFHCCHKNHKIACHASLAQHVLHTCNLLPMPLQQYVLTTPLGKYTHLTWL